MSPGPGDPASEASTEAGTRPRPLGWLFLATSAAWTVWAVGQVARDRNWGTGLCFYVPSPAMAALAVGAALASSLRKRRRHAMVLAIMAVPPVLTVLVVENQWIPPGRGEAPAGAIRLIHWNIAYGDWGEAGVERDLRHRKASLYVLSETPRPFDVRALAARFGPGYDAHRIGAMAFIAEGRLVGTRRLINEPGLKVNAVTWLSRWGPVDIVGVDGPSSLAVPREPWLRRVRALMVAARPHLVLGDFNAPRRSRALRPLPEGFAHAYEAAGRGWSYTWPTVCPLYAIDQCIVGEGVRPLRYALEGTRHSDHLMQVLDFRLDTPGESGPREAPPQAVRARPGPP